MYYQDEGIAMEFLWRNLSIGSPVLWGVVAIIEQHLLLPRVTKTQNRADCNLYRKISK